MIPMTSKLNPNVPDQAIRLYSQTIEPQKSLKSLSVIIDHRASFRIHVAKASNSARGTMGMIAKVTKLRGVSPGAIHHPITSTAIPALLWGSEAWWTGATHVVSGISPTYNSFARLITGLPRLTHIPELLPEVGLPPIAPLFAKQSRQYGMRILLADDIYPWKKHLPTILSTPQPATSRCGLTKIG